jgi:phosphoadenosine phosphosulfate reductase
MIDLAKYSKPALHFSGGKDSLACLYLFKDELANITVYHLNTGDMCPETVAVVEEVKQWIPNFVEVSTNVKKWRDEYGYPSDLAPAKTHWIGVAYGLSNYKLVNRFDCCWSNIMKPMHDRMIADGVDVVIRGTKLSDTGKVPAEGPTDFYDVLLPIVDWTHEEVFSYLEEVGAPKNAIYNYFETVSAPECFGCTAWWDDGKAKYLKDLHPEQYNIYRADLTSIASSISSHMSDLYKELK